MSEQIYEQISKVMADIGSVGKDSKNEQQKYMFRGIEAFYQAAHPALIKHGVFCAPKVLSRDCYRFEKTNDQGRTTTWNHVALEVEHRFYAGDGSHIEVTTWGEGLDNSDKATNKAMSGAMKYALIELFCVPTKDVEDSDRDSPEAGVQSYERPRETRTFGAKPNGAAVEERKGPEAAALPIPRTEVQEQLEQSIEYIDIGRQKNFHSQFRKTIKEFHPDMEDKADDLLYQWLAEKGFRDSKNKLPSASAIPASGWFQTRDNAIAYAKTLKMER